MIRPNCKLYLDQGGDVLAKDPYGSTPLHVACLFGRAEAAELLLDADADFGYVERRRKAS